MSAPVLEADCVSKWYGSRRVLSAGSLRAHPGQVRVLFGANGAGKSTLLKIAAGMLGPDSGSVRLDGAMVVRPSLHRLAHAGVFYLPDHDLLSRSLTLEQQLRLFERRFGGRSAEQAARAARVDSFMDRRPGELSGGELRRAELALVLVRRPRCLLADEPLRGIAPIDQEFLGSIFRALAAEGCAVVVTGHEVDALMEFADHITWCTAGTTHELGTPVQALGHDSFRREYAR